LLAATLTAACSGDDAASPAEPTATVTVCRFERGGAAPVSIPAAGLESAIAGGAYPTELVVDPAGTRGDGVHFTTITAAVAAARSARLARNELDIAACRITIRVVAGPVVGSTAVTTDPTREQFPIVIDVPDITIRGATVLPVDGSGRATGAAVTTATTIAPSTPLQLIGGASSQSGVSEELFVINGHPGVGSKGHGAIIEGLVLRSGHATTDTIAGGQGILSMRVRDISIRGNRFEGNFTERIDLRASSGDVDGNDIVAGAGSTCDVCLAGPGSFVVRNNRVIGGGVPGVLMVPALLLPVPGIVEQFTLPAASHVAALITNNELSGHLKRPVGVGVRVATMGVGAPNVVGDSRATITNNVIRGNMFGMIVEAGFPVNGGSLRGDATISASGNTLSGNCQNDLLVSFSRHTTALGLSNQPYLRSSTFRLTLGEEFTWPASWYAMPAALGNTLSVNGVAVEPLTRAAYSATKACQ